MFYMTPETESLIDRALSEDLSLGDSTTEALVPQGSTGKAGLVAKEEGILAGVDVGLAVFKRVDATLETSKALDDGAGLEAGLALHSTVAHRMTNRSINPTFLATLYS